MKDIIVIVQKRKSECKVIEFGFATPYDSKSARKRKKKFWNTDKGSQLLLEYLR